MRSDLPQNLTPHLTDDQFSDLLAGDTPGERVQAHLDVCEHCRGELAAVQDTLSDFNILSLTWAQRAAARKVQRPSVWSLRISNLPSWGVGLAATVAAVIVLLGIGSPFQHESDTVTANIVLPACSDQEIARDNDMLASIDQHLNAEAEVTTPAQELIISGHESRHRFEAVLSN